MKKKTFLFLTEQTIMLLVFAMAAALCLRVFLWADSRSRENADTDRAYIAAQNAAEQFRHRGGGLPEGSDVWVTQEGNLTVAVRLLPTANPYLSRARVTVTLDSNTLAELTVSCQKGVSP